MMLMSIDPTIKKVLIGGQIKSYNIMDIRKIIEIGIKESSFSILEVDIEPMVRICREIYTITGLKVNDYTLEKTPQDRIVHTWVFPMDRKLTLNLRKSI